MNQDLIVWNRIGDKALLGARCGMCNGVGYFFCGGSPEHIECEHCVGLGWFGIDPLMPVMARPGSTAKVAMLGMRYSLGVPLWNPGDQVAPQPAPAVEPIDERGKLSWDDVLDDEEEEGVEIVSPATRSSPSPSLAAHEAKERDADEERKRRPELTMA